MPEDTTLPALDSTPGGPRRRRLLRWVAGPTVTLAVVAAAGAAWVHRSTAPASGPTAAGPTVTAAGRGNTTVAAAGQPDGATTPQGRGGGPDPDPVAAAAGPAVGQGSGQGSGPGPVIDQRAGATGGNPPAGPSAAASLGGPTPTVPAAGTTVSVGYTFHPGTTVFASADPAGTATAETPPPGAATGAGERVPVGSITVTRAAAGTTGPPGGVCAPAEAAYDVTVAYDRTATGPVPNQFRLPGQTVTLAPGVPRTLCAVPGTTWTLTYPDGTAARAGTV